MDFDDNKYQNNSSQTPPEGQYTPPTAPDPPPYPNGNTYYPGQGEQTPPPPQYQQGYSGYQAPPPSYNSSNLTPPQTRSIGVAILLTIITCGIYGLYWVYTISSDLKNEIEPYDGIDPGIDTLLAFFLSYFYSIYLGYKWARTLGEVDRKYGYPPTDRTALYIVLNVLGLSIVTMAIAQSDLNKIAESKPRPY
jgi:hypothetical protein